MKSNIITLLTAAIIAGFSRAFSNPKEGREECHNAMADSPHPTACVPYTAEVMPSITQLLMKKGTVGGSIALCGATEEPLGPCTDTPNVGDRANVRMLGSAPGTCVMRASAAIAADVRVFTAAGGKISSTGGTGKYLVGRSVTAAAADGDEVEVAHCFPVLQA